MAKARLRLLETTDLHMHLQTHTRPRRGLELLASHIKDLRDDGVATILCDNGDLLQGTPLAAHLMALPPDHIHPAVDALNFLQYDAVTLGNHEFNFPLWRTIAAISGFEMPVVSANVRCGPLATLTKPWAVIKRDLICADGKTRPIKVGIIGFVTPQIVDWDKTHLAGKVQTDDIIAAARTHTPALKRAGADMIVALCHAGIGEAAHQTGMENAVVPLAALDAVDVVLAGHTHDVFPGDDVAASDVIDPVRGTVHGKPTVLAGFNGNHLGVLDLDLTHDDKTGWRIAAHQARVFHAADAQPEPALAARLAETLAAPLAETRAKMDKPLAQITKPMTSHFTMLGYDPTLWLLAEAQQRAADPFLVQSPFANLPVAVAVASFAAGGRAGPDNFVAMKTAITQGDLATLSPFDNAQCVVLRRGWQVRQWLETSAAFFNQIQPDQTGQALINPQFPAYGFDRLIGFDYGYDLSQPAGFDATGGPLADGGTRLTHLRHLGRDIADDALVAVITNSFRANASGAGALNPDDVIHTSKDNITTIVTEYLRDVRQISPNGSAQFSLNPIKGAGAVFQTAPEAKTPPEAYETRATGLTADGFMQFQIAF